MGLFTDKPTGQPVKYHGSQYEGIVTGAAEKTERSGYYTYSVTIRHKATNIPITLHDVREDAQQFYRNNAGRYAPGDKVYVVRGGRTIWYIVGLIPNDKDFEAGLPPADFNVGGFELQVTEDDAVLTKKSDSATEQPKTLRITGEDIEMEQGAAVYRVTPDGVTFKGKRVGFTTGADERGRFIIADQTTIPDNLGGNDLLRRFLLTDYAPPFKFIVEADPADEFFVTYNRLIDNEFGGNAAYKLRAGDKTGLVDLTDTKNKIKVSEDVFAHKTTTAIITDTGNPNIEPEVEHKAIPVPSNRLPGRPVDKGVNFFYDSLTKALEYTVPTQGGIQKLDQFWIEVEISFNAFLTLTPDQNLFDTSSATFVSRMFVGEGTNHVVPFSPALLSLLNQYTVYDGNNPVPAISLIEGTNGKHWIGIIAGVGNPGGYLKWDVAPPTITNENVKVLGRKIVFINLVKQNRPPILDDLAGASHFRIRYRYFHANPTSISEWSHPFYFSIWYLRSGLAFQA